MKKLGLIVNPVAGIGGKVGLKGSDGKETLENALALGASYESGKKTLLALQALKEVQEKLQLYTCPGVMGEDICKEAGIKATVIKISEQKEAKEPETDSRDTIMAAKTMQGLNLDLILFAGGDGTARDILDAVGMEQLVLGIPTGCKIHSGAFAVNPRDAGVIAAQYAKGKIPDTKEAEVMDIDEDLFRQDIVEARLYGYLQIPREEKLVQNRKSGRGYSEDASIELLSNYIADRMEKDTLYIIGTGSTTAAIMKKLDLPNTLLGVDLVYNHKVLASDCTETQILSHMKNYKKMKIIVTVIGGQGYLFGRGNQQISASIIRKVGKENIIVAAAKNKMLELIGRELLVDTGDDQVNKMLSGYMRVIVGYGESVMAPVKG